MPRKRSIFETAQFLIVLGILAGAVGGLAIGIVTSKGSSSSTTTTAAH